MIKIRRATSEDAYMISSLGKQTFTETFENIFSKAELASYLDVTFGISKLENSLNNSSNIFGIAYHLEEPVGYYKVKLDSFFDDSILQRQVQLQKIYVLNAYLDKKVGMLMVQDILKLTEITKYQIIWLVVLHSNSRAISFYEKNGFRVIKKHYHRIGDQNLEYKLMTREIKPVHTIT